MTPTKFVLQLLIVPAVALLLLFALNANKLGKPLSEPAKVVHTETSICTTYYYSDGTHTSC